ncbi:MAG: DUF427 domain-containing protein [Geminicoccaceae bacterium]|nr:DUF427 domain-containing protein [Geminicoccaceae bacterium]
MGKESHTVEVRPFRGTVRVEANGATLASTTRALLLEETGYPRRFYVPEADIEAELSPNPRRTHCPFKGDAAYANTSANGLPIEAVAWSYPNPIADVPDLAGHWCFDPGKTETVVEEE